MPERSPTRIPFARRSRKARMRVYWRVLNDIRRASPVLGGRFYTSDYLNGENGWIDGYFLGTKKPVFYNFALETTTFAYKELVARRAWEMSFGIAPIDVDSSILDRSVFDPVSGLNVTRPYESTGIPHLSGMTRYEWAQAQYPQIANSGDIKVFEHWALHHDYSRGIGLHATIDAPAITVRAVNEFIDRFLMTESAFESQVPRSFRFDEIGNWDIEVNSIVQPWEWESTTKS
jgi:hypothetical protein